MSSPFSSPFVQGMSAKLAKQPVVRSTPALPAVPVSTGLGANKKQYNPFLAAMNNDSAEFREVYGVNRPLNKPMFLGYRDDKAVFAGSRLFILY